MNNQVIIHQASAEGIFIIIFIYIIFWIINSISKSNQEEKIASIPKLSLEVDRGKAPERFKLENEDKSLNIVNLSELDLKDMLQTSKEALIHSLTLSSSCLLVFISFSF